MKINGSMLRLLSLFLVFSCCSLSGYSIVKDGVQLEELVRSFEKNPANPQVTIRLLKELDKQGKSGKDILERYFQTQKETDYFKDYNWVIVRDYVHDIHSPQFKFLFANHDKFMLYFSKDDVFQKVDNMLVQFLESLYQNNQEKYNAYLQEIKSKGYEHYDVVYDYFYIKQLRVERNAEDYFYKARKLFRYFPENRKMIKEITAGALEIMDDVARLKVIQLWAGKTVEQKNDFDALYNYVLLSERCGFSDVARRYATIADNLAVKSNSELLRKRMAELRNQIR